MSARILLVEDDPLSLKLMRDLLEAHGYETLDVRDGNDVLTRASEFQPDLVVMDVGLPGQDGVQATRLLKATEKGRVTPVVAVTAYAMPADEQRMRQAGCDAFLTKPLEFSRFLAVVQRLAPLSPDR
jgi:two-component system, cell cycle response regulator DivK